MKKLICVRMAVPALWAMTTACWADGLVQPIPQDVLVTTTRVAFREMDAPYAVEVHTREDIQASGAMTLYDYLAKFSGLQVGSAFGNKEAPLLNMRGYGFENGYQNMVVSLNGQRLNAIDQSSPILSAISLDAIEKIEISRGVGSSLYGDGAMAGVVEITTRALDGYRVQAHAGSYGATGVAAQAAQTFERVQVEAGIEDRRFDGYVQPDAQGQRDGSKAGNWRLGLIWQTQEGLKLKASMARSDIDGRYNDYFTAAQWRQDPFVNRGINRQRYNQATDGVSMEMPIGGTMRMGLSHQEQTRTSDLLTWYGSTIRYDYRQTSDEVHLNGKHDHLSWRTGVQQAKASREDGVGRVHKDNRAYFANLHYSQESRTWMLGIRREKVSYLYTQPSSADLGNSHDLPMWEVGLNQTLSSTSSWFATYAKSRLAPDVDRFYSAIYDTNPPYQVVGQSFNGFVVPAQAATWTLGYNHQTTRNRLKLAVFRADLKNEIYLEPVTYSNTNIDRSHKYGLEIQDQWAVRPGLAARATYTYTVAKIDSADSTDAAYNGKNLPGVSRDTLLWGLRWQPQPRHVVNVSQVWRGSAYAFKDFSNTYAIRQPIYRSTDVSYEYRWDRQTQFFVAVNNLLQQNNAIVVGSTTPTNLTGFYAIDFARTWLLGLRHQF